jgi:chromosome segregation ATPase
VDQRWINVGVACVLAPLLPACFSQAAAQAESERLQQQLSDSQRSTAAAATAADAATRDLKQQLATAQHSTATLQAAQQQALAVQQQRLQEEQAAHAETQQRLAAARQQLLASQARLGDAESRALAAEARATHAENQAAAMAGAEAQVLLRMLQGQVQQQRQQLEQLQGAATVAAAVPELQASLAAARAEAEGCRAQLLELQHCKTQLQQMQEELGLFRTAFKVNTHGHGEWMFWGSWTLPKRVHPLG